MNSLDLLIIVALCGAVAVFLDIYRKYSYSGYLACALFTTWIGYYQTNRILDNLPVG